MKKIFCVLVMLLFVGFIVSCDKSDNGTSMQENKPEKLFVYAVGDMVLTNYGEEFFTSRYLLGEFSSMAEMWGEKGYMYYDAIVQFEEETDIDIEIKFFIDTYELLKEIETAVKNGDEPDIIIGSYTSERYNLYPYFENGYFADLKPYFDQDEIYTSGEYVSKVIEAGIVENNQYIFPLTFNMNLLFTSNESMKRHDLWLSEDMSYQDLVTLFSEGWQQQDRDDEILMMQYTNMRNNYPCIFFQAASGEQLIDYETGIVNLDDTYFYELIQIYESYLCNDYGMSREELKSLALQNEGYLPEDHSSYAFFSGANVAGENVLDIHDLTSDKIACFAEGGNCSYYMHSFASQTYYYGSRFLDAEEDFVCFGIPSRMNSDNYAAQVTTFGAVLQNSNYPEYGYSFLKNLADTEKWLFWDFSVNKSNINSTLDFMVNTYYELYPALGNFSPEREPEDADWLGDSYQIKPMSQESADYICNMVDNIGVARLPEFMLNDIITKEIASYIYGNTDTKEQAYQKALQRLKSVALYNEINY